MKPRLLWLPAALLVAGCMTEEALHQKDPVKYWKERLSKTYEGAIPNHPMTVIWVFVRSDDVPPLIAILGENDDFFQWAAAQVLSEAEPGDARPALPRLKELLGSRNPHVRAVAVSVLGRIGKEALPALMEALEDQSIAFLAIGWIGDMGPDAKAAVPRLTRIREKAVREGDELLAGLAEDSLKAITGENQVQSSS